MTAQQVLVCRVTLIIIPDKNYKYHVSGRCFYSICIRIIIQSCRISSNPDYHLIEPFKRLPNKRWYGGVDIMVMENALIVFATSNNSIINSNSICPTSADMSESIL